MVFERSPDFAPAQDIHTELRLSLEETRRMTQLPPESLLRLDVALIGQT